MTNFTPIVFLDAFDLACSLRARMGLFKPVEGGGREIAMRYPKRDGSGWLQSREAAKWQEYRNTLSQIKRLGELGLHEVEFGRIAFDLLPPRSTLPWATHEADDPPFLLAVLPIRTNPLAVTFSGAEGMHLLPGRLTIVNRMPPCSAINLGDHGRVHLTIEFRQHAREIEQ